jgi:uncharacterized protein YbaP (TraB family)
MKRLLDMLRYRGWIAGALVILLAGAAALMWAGRSESAHPALWRVSQGDRHAWLFGTIHSVPRRSQWLSPAIEEAAQESDWLVLEASDLAAERNDRAVFETLGRSAGLPPVSQRIEGPDRESLTIIKRAAPDVLTDIDRYESWAAALLISAAANRDTSQAQAGEARFEHIFRSSGRRVLGLETVKQQLSLFDTLPDADQRAMLSQAIAASRNAADQYQQLYKHWAAGDIAALERLFLVPLDATPELKRTLLDQRNASWARQIDALMRQSDKRLFIAVGAGHLLGLLSVQAQLAERGWKVERIQ